MKKILIYVAILFVTSCDNQNSSKTETITGDPIVNQKAKPMKSYVSIFEIPAMEISRAVDFYQAILEINIEKMEMPNMQMGIFPYEEQMVTGVIVQAEGYQPSADGITIYLNGGDNLQIILDRVEKNGGKIVIPKTPHADGSEFFAVFLDSEGNRIGVHSPN